jgi:hypothetical protein
MKGNSQLGRLEVSTYCQNCDDFATAVPAGDSVNRCTECGAYCTDEPDVCCARHEVRNSPYPSGICPYCEQENQVRAMEQEMAERRSNPRIHNTVDAPRW